MKSISVICLVSLAYLLAGCNKYNGVSEKQLSGYLTVKDPLTGGLPRPLAGTSVYLNKGSDTSSYILSAKTDSAGRFTFSFGSDKAVVLFVRYISNGTEYTGQTRLTDVRDDLPLHLEATPIYQNGFAVAFQDAAHGILANVNFRLYKSKLIAQVDSVKYAVLNTKTDNQGYFLRYNFLPAKYYIVAKDSIGSQLYQSLDSLTLQPSGLENKGVILK